MVRGVIHLQMVICSARNTSVDESVPDLKSSTCSYVLQSVIIGRHMQTRDIIIHLYCILYPGIYIRSVACRPAGLSQSTIVKMHLTMTFQSSWLSRVVPPRGLSTRTVPFSRSSSGQNPSSYVCFDRVVGASSPCNHTHRHGRFRVPPLKVAVISRIALDKKKLSPAYEE
jgi:hypothetical protein